MKKFIIVLFAVATALLTLNNCNAAERTFIFRDYYFNMTIDEAEKISNLVQKNEDIDLYKRFNTGGVKFANHYWNVELFFDKKNKLRRVDLNKTNNDDIIIAQVLNEFNTNNVSGKITLTQNYICDTTKIVKDYGSDYTEQCLVKSFLDIKKERFFTKVFLDNEIYSSVFTQNQRKKMKDFFEIMNKFPDDKRVIVFNNVHNSYTIIFGTPLDALIAVSAHIEVAKNTSSIKSF